MRYVTVLGAGLLVGTALAVIIPEGVHALYLNEMETNQLETQHEFQHEHKVASRHLNEFKETEARHDRSKKNVKDDLLPPAHEHHADHPRDLRASSSSKHSDTTHSAIGRRTKTKSLNLFDENRFSSYFKV